MAGTQRDRTENSSVLQRTAGLVTAAWVGVNVSVACAAGGIVESPAMAADVFSSLGNHVAGREVFKNTRGDDLKGAYYKATGFDRDGLQGGYRPLCTAFELAGNLMVGGLAVKGAIMVANAVPKATAALTTSGTFAAGAYGVADNTNSAVDVWPLLKGPLLAPQHGGMFLVP